MISFQIDHLRLVQRLESSTLQASNQVVVQRSVDDDQKRWKHRPGPYQWVYDS